ncbi:transcriptional regulator [Sporosarcina sp. SAFN-010]|uniref:transcriptional regulator n=1 Tax=Sporosarcina sp. SAFN-010 TaxID=3387273 RepID=UPI003F8030B3
MTTKLRVGTVKHIEAEFFDYYETLKRIQQRREELLAGSNEELVGGKSNLPSDPTGSVVSRMIADKQLEEYERITSAIEHVYNLCDDNRKKLIRLKYWTKPQLKSWEGIAQEISISRATAFRWRDEIIQAVGELLGWR